MFVLKNFFCSVGAWTPQTPPPPVSPLIKYVIIKLQEKVIWLYGSGRRLTYGEDERVHDVKHCHNDRTGHPRWLEGECEARQQVNDESTTMYDPQIHLLAAQNQSAPHHHRHLGAVAYHVIYKLPWLQLRFDYDTTTIRLRRIARPCFHSTRFDAIKKWTCQFFVVVVS